MLRKCLQCSEPTLRLTAASRLGASAALSTDDNPPRSTGESDRKSSNAETSTSAPKSTLSRIFGQRRPTPATLPEGATGARGARPTRAAQQRAGAPSEQGGRMPQSRQLPFRQPSLERPRQLRPPYRAGAQQDTPPRRDGKQGRDGFLAPPSDLELDDAASRRSTPTKREKDRDARVRRSPPPGALRQPRAGSAERRPPAQRPIRRPSMPRRRGMDQESPLEIAYHKDVERYTLAPSEPMALLEKGSLERIRSTADLPVYDTHELKEAQRAALMQLDPAVNFNWGAPTAAQRRDPGELADAMRDELMAEHGMETEEQWQEYKAANLEGIEKEADAIDAAFNRRDVKADERRLEALLADVPASNPLYAHIDMSVRELQRNPWWPFEQKELYVKGLVRLAQK